MMGDVAHYLSEDHIARSLLIGFRSLSSDHSGVNQADSVCPVLKDVGIASKAVLEYLILDNASPNDTAIEELCRLLKIQN